MERNDLGSLIVMTADQVDDLPWQAVGGDPGLMQKLLWVAGPVRLGLMRIEPGHTNPVHVHSDAQHHILVTQGSATMLGQELAAGSYVYVPPGTPHGVTDVGPEGVTFFFTYRPLEEEPQEDDRGRHPAVSDAEAAVAF